MYASKESSLPRLGVIVTRLRKLALPWTIQIRGGSGAPFQNGTQGVMTLQPTYSGRLLLPSMIV